MHQGRIEAEMQQFEANAMNKRLLREQARSERDRAMEDAIIRAQCEKKLAAEARSQDERLASELERVKHEKLRDEKMRQQIRYGPIKIFSYRNSAFVLVKQATNYAN